MVVKTITEGTEPISVPEAQAHCKISASTEESWITRAIRAAREHAEDVLNRTLQIAPVFEVYLDAFPCRIIEIPGAPLQSVTFIKYLDTNGTLQTLDASNYQVDAVSEPGRVAPAYNCIWPQTRCDLNAVVIRYVAGPTSAAGLPDKIRQAMLMMVQYWDRNRGDMDTGTLSEEMSLSVKSLLASRKIWSFA